MSKNLLFFNSLFLFLIRAFWLILGKLTFAKFVEFLNKSTFREGMCFFLFQPEDMFDVCLNLNESCPIYAHKCYTYKKECNWIPCTHKPFWKLITLVFFAVTWNANLFVHDKLTKLSFRNLKYVLLGKHFVMKKLKT